MFDKILALRNLEVSKSPAGYAVYHKHLETGASLFDDFVNFVLQYDSFELDEIRRAYRVVFLPILNSRGIVLHDDGFKVHDMRSFKRMGTSKANAVILAFEMGLWALKDVSCQISKPHLHKSLYKFLDVLTVEVDELSGLFVYRPTYAGLKCYGNLHMFANDFIEIVDYFYPDHSFSEYQFAVRYHEHFIKHAVRCEVVEQPSGNFSIGVPLSTYSKHEFLVFIALLELELLDISGADVLRPTNSTAIYRAIDTTTGQEVFIAIGSYIEGYVQYAKIKSEKAMAQSSSWLSITQSRFVRSMTGQDFYKLYANLQYIKPLT